MVEIINKTLWLVASIFLILGGIYFTKKTKGVQFHFKELILSLKADKIHKVTPFQTLTLALGARIGVGSIAGIALSIQYGGVGSIFWIWLVTLIIAPNSYIESNLSVKYQEKDNDINKGGPSYYIEKALRNKKLAIIYAIILLFTYLLGFIPIQSNTIATLLNSNYDISKTIIGLLLGIITIIVIVRGTTKIANFTSKMVPFMSIIYLLVALFIIFTSFSKIPSLIYQIVTTAFNIKELGFGVITAFIIGVERSIFSNEAGIGTGAIASGLSEISPDKQGKVQLLGVYFTTFIICTSTAIIILTSPYQTLSLPVLNGIEMTEFAINHHLGSLGNFTLLITIIFFAFSTIISGYYYTESTIKYLIKNIKEKNIKIFKVIASIIVFLGSIITASIIWNVVDTLVAVLAIINIYAIIKIVKKEGINDRK